MITGAPGASASAQRAENLRDPGDVLLDRRPARPARGRAELDLATIVQAEQLVRVAVLLVVVDQARDTAAR